LVASVWQSPGASFAPRIYVTQVSCRSGFSPTY
jgi:hypothetical protein